MPQLMPLNWIFSSMMLLIVMLVSCMIYSEKMNVMTVNNKMNNKMNNLNMWCW